MILIRMKLSWLARNHGISKETLSNWVRKYKEAGVEGLEESRHWTKYSKELKEQAVSDYLMAWEVSKI